MKINVRNYRAITSAEFEFDRIALIGAPNEGGKSSLTQAISTVVLGESVVLDGIKVSEAGSLVRSGSPKAELHIEGDTGEASLTLPTGKLHTKGERPPRASRFALGLTAADGGERITDLRRMLGSRRYHQLVLSVLR